MYAWPSVARAQGLAQRGDVDAQVRFLDEGVGPDPLQQLFLGDHVARALDQRDQEVEGPRGDLDQRRRRARARAARGRGGRGRSGTAPPRSVGSRAEALEDGDRVGERRPARGCPARRRRTPGVRAPFSTDAHARAWRRRPTAPCATASRRGAPRGAAGRASPRPRVTRARDRAAARCRTAPRAARSSGR